MKISGLDNGTYQNSSVKTEENKTNEFQSIIDKAVKTGNKEELKKVADDFESIIVNYLFKSMRSSIPESGLFEKSQGREIFEGMLDEELSKLVAKSGDLGFADMIYNQMSKFIDEDPVEAEEGTDAVEETKVQSLDLKG